MPCIAVVDDAVGMRQTVCRLIRQQLKNLTKDDAWEVIESAPFPSIDDYDSWVNENEVSVLVLDERLDEKYEGSEAVNYKGHQVASHLRTRFRDLPQFIVTAIDNPEELDKSGADLEAVISRKAFQTSTAVYVQRMIRLGQSFYKEHEKRLSRLSELSSQAAEGVLSDANADELRALRQLILLTSSPADLDQVLDKADEILAELKDVAGSLRVRNTDR